MPARGWPTSVPRALRAPGRVHPARCSEVRGFKGAVLQACRSRTPRPGSACAAVQQPSPPAGGCSCNAATVVAARWRMLLQRCNGRRRQPADAPAALQQPSPPAGGCSCSAATAVAASRRMLLHALQQPSPPAGGCSCSAATAVAASRRMLLQRCNSVAESRRARFAPLQQHRRESAAGSAAASYRVAKPASACALPEGVRGAGGPPRRSALRASARGGARSARGPGPARCARAAA
jgi:hypothetical protein